jgi:hypothetical protein
MAEYSYLVADLAGGDLLDELPLSGVSFSTQLNDAGDFRAQLVLGDSRLNRHDFSRVTEPGHTALYVLRDGIPVWGGVLWTSSYASSVHRVDLGAAGFLSYFDHRLVLPAAFDPVSTAVAGVSVSFPDRPELLPGWLVDLAQHAPGGDIGVQIPEGPAPGDVPVTNPPAVYPGSQLKTVGDAVRELTSLDGGPDFVFTVDLGPDRRLVRRLLVAPSSTVPNEIPLLWEYGANLVEYTWPRDGSAMATRVFALGETTDTGQLVAAAAGPDGPLTETVVSYLHITDPARLASLARSALDAGSQPVVVPELIVRADREPVLGSYQVGDYARIVIRDELFPEGAEFIVRITTIEVTVGDDQGAESVRLTVMPIPD